MTARPLGVSVIDFGLRPEAEARAYPVLYQIVRDRVKPERDANRRPSLATTWWRFGYPRIELREALVGLSRYIVTVETQKHRFFTFLSAEVAPDNMLTVVATDEPSVLGVLSSAIHVASALAAGGRLGVGNDPRYTKALCFEAFPFPDPLAAVRRDIGDRALRLDEHRKAALARSPKVTMTGMYNALVRLRAGEALSPTERKVHELAACDVLGALHDELDAAVAGAYGWEWPVAPGVPLERLVALHDLRVSEEQHGVVRWLRPDYQKPRLGRPTDAHLAMELEAERVAATTAIPPDAPLPWPTDAVGSDRDGPSGCHSRAAQR